MDNTKKHADTTIKINTDNPSARKANELSGEELFAYSSRHLYYEVLMLRNGISSPRPTDPFMRTFLLEACVLHARNLIEFLFRKATGTTLGYDLYLEQKHEWTPPPMSPGIEQIKFRGDKQVAHLTTSRQQENLPEVPYEVVPFVELLSIFDTFVAQASPRLLDKDALWGTKQPGLVLQTGDSMAANAVSQTIRISSPSGVGNLSVQDRDHSDERSSIRTTET